MIALTEPSPITESAWQNYFQLFHFVENWNKMNWNRSTSSLQSVQWRFLSHIESVAVGPTEEADEISEYQIPYESECKTILNGMRYNFVCVLFGFRFVFLLLSVGFSRLTSRSDNVNAGSTLNQLTCLTVRVSTRMNIYCKNSNIFHNVMQWVVTLPLPGKYVAANFGGERYECVFLWDARIDTTHFTDSISGEI